jgi:tRNA U55 pseudouridine synthase TruB
VDDLEIISVGPGPYPEVVFRVVCGKGTYVRSLADDMAGVLGGAAHLTALRRLRIGSLHVDDGLVLEDMDEWRSHLISPAEALGDLPLVAVGDETAKGVYHGMRFVGGDITDGPSDRPYRVVDASGTLLAVYSRVGREARPEVVLPS